MKYITLILLLATIVAAKSQSGNCVTNPPDFVNLPYQEIDNMLYSEEHKKICPEYIENLVNELRNPSLNNDNKTLAIYFLGELHSSNTNAIEFLTEDIDFRATKFDPKTRFQRWGFYPAEEALIKIGKPVVDPILNHLPAETSELRRQLMCDVLKKVWQHN